MSTHFESLEANPERDQMLREAAFEFTKKLKRRVSDGLKKSHEQAALIQTGHAVPVYSGPLPDNMAALLSPSRDRPPLLIQFRLLGDNQKGLLHASETKTLFGGDFKLIINISPSAFRPEDALRTLFHELIHMLDWLRAREALKNPRRGPLTPRQYPTEEETRIRADHAKRRQYLQTPGEFNAWFQTGAQEFVSGLRHNDTVPLEFDAFLMLVVANVKSLAEQEFYLKGDWHRKFRVRLWQLHEALKESQGASVTSVSEMQDLGKRYAETRKRVLPKIRLMSKNKKRWIYKDLDKE